MSNSFRTIGSWLLDALLPTPCLGCRVIVASTRGFCADCRQMLEVNDCRWLDELPLCAPYRYCGPMTQAIVSLKYEERAEFAARLVDACFPENAPFEWQKTRLVPVPIHPMRLVERGYNQAALLARALGKRWQLPVLYQALERRTFVARQVGLGRMARAENAAQAFSIGRQALTGATVLLVDDVVTTGATLRSCQTVLREAGAVVVGIAALARADAFAVSGNAEVDLSKARAKNAVLGLGL